MVVLKRKIEDLPKDAIVLTEDEAAEAGMQLIKHWKPPSEVFALKYGSIILGGASTVVGSCANMYFRRKFKLGGYGRYSSNLPSAVIPALTSLLLHAQFITRDVILSKPCPLCLELRAVSLQALTGCAIPVALAQLSSMSLAVRYATYSVPYITQQPLETLRMLVKITKPIKGILIATLMGQAVLASVVTYFEQSAVEKVNSRLIQIEHNLYKLGEKYQH